MTPTHVKKKIRRSLTAMRLFVEDPIAPIISLYVLSFACGLWYFALRA